MSTGPSGSTTSATKADELDGLMEINLAEGRGIDSEAAETLRAAAAAAASLSRQNSSVISRRRFVDYLVGKKNAALNDIFRLVGLLIIAFASIVCIALDKERIYFTNVLTFVLGVIVDSPLAQKRDSYSPSSSRSHSRAL